VLKAGKKERRRAYVAKTKAEVASPESKKRNTYRSRTPSREKRSGTPKFQKEKNQMRYEPKRAERVAQTLEENLSGLGASSKEKSGLEFKGRKNPITLDARNGNRGKPNYNRKIAKCIGWVEKDILKLNRGKSKLSQPPRSTRLKTQAEKKSWIAPRCTTFRPDLWETWG